MTPNNGLCANESESWITLFLQGSASRLVYTRDLYLQSFTWPPTDQMTFMSHRLTRVYDDSKPPVKVNVDIELQGLHDVIESDFEFEISWQMQMSWSDPRIFANCDQAGVDGFDSRDACQFFFQPQLIFVNIKLDQHPEAQPEPKILSAFGLTTNLANLSASMGGRYRGKFMAGLLFQKFPYDTQKLVASMRAPVDMPYHKLQFVSKARMTENPQYLRKMQSAGGRWKVTKVWAEDTLRETQEGIGSTFNFTRRAQIELCIQVSRLENEQLHLECAIRWHLVATGDTRDGLLFAQSYSRNFYAGGTQLHEWAPRI